MPTTPAKHDIIIDNISKSFGEKNVLSHFSACFPFGEKSSIMAASGKGKTTLLRIMLGLEVPDDGTISGMHGKKIAMVFQEDRLCENLSAAANISMVCQRSKHDIKHALAKAGLENEADTPVHTLSGGMKRRVSILRALLYDADIILMDEPFKGLDEDTKLQMIRLVSEYAGGKTLILVTHIHEELEALGTIYNIEL